MYGFSSIGGIGSASVSASHYRGIGSYHVFSIGSYQAIIALGILDAPRMFGFALK
jgi:hypothetical protein